MPARAVARTGAARRSMKRRVGGAPVPSPAAGDARGAELDDWVEADDDRLRLQEGEMEILLTGHAATHGDEGEDNWLIDSEERNWGER